METKFTEGEWCNTNGIITQKGKIQKVIANTYANRFAGNEQKANAKLIAAAPELLNACISVNKYFVDLQNKCALTSSDERAWKQVSIAIKKATE